MQLSQFLKIANKKGYSLLEMLITLLVVNIILLMLSNILIMSLKVSIKAQERSHAREEITNIVNLIKRDFRNANGIVDYNTFIDDNATDPSTADFIELTYGTKTVRWRKCDNTSNNPVTTSVCKYVVNAGVETLEYMSSASLNITEFKIAEVGVSTQMKDQVSVLITVRADHSNERLDIAGLYRQVLLSTRNYRI